MAKKLYVGNLNNDTTEDTLRGLFAAHGEVSAINVITDHYTGWSRGFAFVEMATEKAAEAAIVALNGRRVDGRQLKVLEVRRRTPRGVVQERFRDQDRRAR